MSAFRSPAALAACAAVVALALPSLSQAQGPWGLDARRASRPGAYVPYDGAPFSHRYNYVDAPLFLWGDYGRSWWAVEQLDRVERFETFGTRYGPDNPPLFNRILERRRR